MSTILVTGAGGQVGQECRALQSNFPEFQFHYASRAELDIADRQAITAMLEDIRPDYVVNCAAYTAVDRAESEPQEAFRINETAAGHLAYACRGAGCHLIHFSTDYVYRNDLNRPLRETDALDPIGAYAASKLAGELAIRQQLPQSTIIRTSWIYSNFGHNFYKTMQRLGRERSELRVVYDQVGTPTYARDLVRTVLHMIQAVESDSVDRAHLRGIFNFSNEGVTSWYDFTLAILELLDINCRVHAIESKDFPSAAERPHFSVLNKEKIKSTFGLHIDHWRAALERCLKDGEVVRW